MKKSKSSSSSKGKRKRSPVVDKRKHAKPLPTTVDKQNKKDNEDKLPRKTRWEASKSNSKDDTDKLVASSRTDETSNPEPPRRIKEMLGDKMKIIEYLFQTVTVTALQDIIPDYLKNRSIEELKKMCYDEIKLLEDEFILKIASGKFSSYSGEAKPSRSNDQPANSNNIATKEDDVNRSITLDRQSSPVVSEALTNDLLELCATSDEMKDLADNECGVSVEEEVTDDLGIIDNVSLIELEMRARAIRSLLKAKGQTLSDSE